MTFIILAEDQLVRRGFEWRLYFLIRVLVSKGAGLGGLGFGLCRLVRWSAGGGLFTCGWFSTAILAAFSCLLRLFSLGVARLILLCCSNTVLSCFTHYSHR
jgi:hypothetical protein